MVQHGTASPPLRAEGVRLLDHATLESLLREATVVVSHGGPATIAEARAAGRLPVVVPRDPRHGEHVDDHQQRFARRLGAAGLVRLCEDEKSLHAALDGALRDPESVQLHPADSFEDPAGEAGPAGAAARVGAVVDALVDGRRARSAKDPQAVRVLFVGGLGRSGSTLVDRVMSQMTEVCSVGELVHLWERAVRDDERCGCGLPFHRCPFWTEVGQIAFGGWAAVDVSEVLRLRAAVDRTRFIPRLALPRLPDAVRADLDRYTDLHLRVYQAVRQVSGCEVVLDSSKHASLAFALRWSRGVDLRVLHLVRDARGVAYSWSKQVRRPEVVDDVDYMPQYSPTYVSALWTAQNAAFHLLRATRVPVLRLRYEDVLDDPETALHRLRAFCGLPPRPGGLDFLHEDRVDLGVGHTVAGNPMRFRTGSVALRRDEQWHTELPPRSRRVVSALTFPMRARYGYLGRDR